jgi:hypothetical protein
MKPCYFQGCLNTGETKEHIPPKAFFPKDQRDQLFTVPSCKAHNNDKSTDDLYVIAHICLNASPKNRAREVFEKSVLPQLKYNEGKLRDALIQDAIPMGNGAVKYRVDFDRLDRFFSALSCGIVFKACQSSLPIEYSIRHVYHDFHDDEASEFKRQIEQEILRFYSQQPKDIFDFGKIAARNVSIYSAKVFGVSDFRSSITVRHEFFGAFRVTSMLTKKFSLGKDD